ncbi:MAG: bifunctional methionine sulfoxide reductase B/A protein [Phycisphaerae bacterium]|nr:bifunctional methionine sulfoxide reductase B/A protein [Phycisphaerae bacterium]
MSKKLTQEEDRVMMQKGTEAPFSGKYYKHSEKGVYTCKNCGAPLYESSAKFESGTGWPSFDEYIKGSVKTQPDGSRTEIVCAKCGAHLGHVFEGEGFTGKNTRHCVNSVCLNFMPKAKTERAFFASGCFWGTEYYLKKQNGVISTTVGYTGGNVENPTYKQVCTGKTGHAESVEVVYDPNKVTYEQLVKLFFETHDFTQLDRQGPDIGKQYRSAIFYLDENQKKTADAVIDILRKKGDDVKTELTAAGEFWPAEDYHQDYYDKTQKQPYCHIYRKIFDVNDINAPQEKKQTE